MNSRDFIKGMVEFVNTAELPPEAARTLVAKLSVLDDQVAGLENDHARLKDENEKLKIQIKCLQPQQEEVSQETIGVMKLFYEQAGEISADEISRTFKWNPSIADYHLDVLLKKRFIRESSVRTDTIFGSGIARYGLTTLGRRYILQYLTV